MDNRKGNVKADNSVSKSNWDKVERGDGQVGYETKKAENEHRNQVGHSCNNE